MNLEIHNQKVGALIPTFATQKIGELIAGGVEVHLLAMAEVPLSKAPYPHAPRALWLSAHRSCVYGIYLHKCVTLCMCVQQVFNLDGLNAEE